MPTLAATTPSLARAADIILAHDLSIVPVANLKDKRPGPGPWKRYMKEPAQPTEARSWFVANGHPAAEGIGIVCGAVSGGLTVIDFDTDECGNSRFHAWCALVEQADTKLLHELPTVQTPSGGFHVYVRAGTCPGNQRLALTADGRVLIETRGEGGYVVAPPSPGYRTIVSSVTSVPTLDDEAFAFLLHCARSLDERPESQPEHGQAPPSLPMDDATLRSLLDEPLSLLIKHGWAVAGRSGDKLLMRRPGKDSGNSATLGHWEGVPVFYAFSTNVEGVPVGEALNTFKLYAHLEHGGDFVAARRALAPNVARQSGPWQAGGADPGADFQAPKYAPLKRLKDLLANPPPPATFAVPGIVPDGLVLLAGPPKAGKSLLCLGMALGIAQGGYVLSNIKVEKRPVIYYVLEDGERTFAQRAQRIIAEQGCPEDFYYRDELARLDQGALDVMRQDLADHPGALMVVDTFQRVRPLDPKGSDAYQKDSNAAFPLAQWVVKEGITCILVHHVTKASAEDFLAEVSGSFGLTATAGNTIVLKRTRLRRELHLLLTGRAYDEEQELVVEYDPATMQHSYVGTADEVGDTHIEHGIFEALGFTGEELKPTELLNSIEGASIDGVKKALKRLFDKGLVVQDRRGYYRVPNDSEQKFRALRALRAPRSSDETGGGCAQANGTNGTEGTKLPIGNNVPSVPQPAAPGQGVLLATSCVACGAAITPWRELSNGQEPFCRKCWREPGAGKRSPPTGSA